MNTPSRSLERAWLRTATILVVALLASCGQREEPVAERSEVAAPTPGPSASDVDRLSARDALALANRWKDSMPSLTSIVDTQRIAFQFADGSTAEVPLPAEEMVVAIPPYLKNTHPCAVHVMSGCQGELVAAPLTVRGVTADGVGRVQWHADNRDDSDVRRQQYLYHDDAVAVALRVARVRSASMHAAHF